MTELNTQPALRGAAVWAGWAISGLLAASFLMGGVLDIVRPPFVIEGLSRAGYSAADALPLGVITITSALLYVWPKTAVVGAILLTGYLGGAVATHVRMGEHGQMLVPVAFAVVMWVGLVLRDRRMHAAVFG